MANIKKVITVEFDGSDIKQIAQAFSAFEAIAVGFEIELNYGRLQETDKETRSAIADLVQEIRRATRRLETFIPQEVRSF